jgi:Fe2+ or Zn2+ uptake regulation protein
MSINKLNKFLEEISKLSPLNEDLLKYSSQEIFIINQIQNKKKIDTIELYKENKKHFSRAQFYRYLSKLKKLKIIDIKKGKIEIFN